MSIEAPLAQNHPTGTAFTAIGSRELRFWEFRPKAEEVMRTNFLFKMATMRDDLTVPWLLFRVLAHFSFTEAMIAFIARSKSV